MYNILFVSLYMYIHFNIVEIVEDEYLEPKTVQTQLDLCSLASCMLQATRIRFFALCEACSNVL